MFRFSMYQRTDAVFSVPVRIEMTAIPVCGLVWQQGSTIGCVPVVFREVLMGRLGNQGLGEDVS